MCIRDRYIYIYLRYRGGCNAEGSLQYVSRLKVTSWPIEQSRSRMLHCDFRGFACLNKAGRTNKSHPLPKRSSRFGVEVGWMADSLWDKHWMCICNHKTNHETGCETKYEPLEKCSFFLNNPADDLVEVWSSSMWTAMWHVGRLSTMGYVPYTVYQEIHDLTQMTKK